ncbi:4Fe-4S dicluster domain-containing protein [Candidatus Methanomassiliicoccus intestinalis]|uniref:4Fe-4S dicluster domain-containing protein n=1 Tax=Candidatus Methanomassiliicoccus intestinalis TaxID=1406512 RepID=UPI0037DDCA7A
MRRIIVDLEKCKGCRQCEKACSNTHSAKTLGVLKPLPRVKILFTQSNDGKKGSPYPMRCHHCEIPKCVESCMAGALIKTKDGLVIHEADRCVGCWMCVMTCPYGAIFRDTEHKIVVKCDTCLEDKIPACVAVCKFDAMRIEESE